MIFAIEEDAGKTPYDSLSDLCTILVIADEGEATSLRVVFHTVIVALQKAGGDGDVMVMATRALALLLDKHSRSLTLSNKGEGSKEVNQCFRTVFSILRNRKKKLKYERTTVKELNEELLKCLSLASNCAVLSSLVPSTEEQLRFCSGALDGSKWTACKVLRHCIGLMRGGELTGVGNQVVKELLHHHLSSLCHLDIDYEWDELLRIVVEGILTYRVWSGGNAENACVEGPTPTQARKRLRDTSAASTTFSTGIEEGLLDIGERVCGSGTAESRVQLTVACLASILESAGAQRLAANTRQRAIDWISRLLQQTTARGAAYSNPFARRRAAGGLESEPSADVFQALPSLQWAVPPLPWSALVLLAKVSGADLGFAGEYMWAWRGDGGDYYPYPREIRKQITDMFFAAERTTRTLQRRRCIDLRAMTETSTSTGAVARIHFQPVPCAVTFSGRLVVPPKTVCMSAALAAQLHDVLRPLAFGHTQIAALARALRLFVLCCAPPSRGEDALAALRSLPLEHRRAAVEGLSAALIERDRRWAAVLRESGIADALAAPPGPNSPNAAAMSAPTSGHGGHGGFGGYGGHGGFGGYGGHGGFGGRAARRPQGGTSPVARLIRSAVSPPLAPLRLPARAPAAALRGATPAELVAFIESIDDSEYGHEGAGHCGRAQDGEPVSHEEAFSEVSPRDAVAAACAEADMDESFAARLRAAVHTFLLRTLHQASVTHPVRQFATRVSGTSHAVGICTPANDAGAARCAQDHPLRVHFSVNWRCDVCHGTSAYGSLACRVCDYDLCCDCANARLSRLDVSATAAVGDVVRAWRDCLAKESAAGDGAPHAARAPPAAGTRAVLFSSLGVLSAGAPTAACVLGRDTLHFADAFGTCRCGVAAPAFVNAAVKPPAVGCALQRMFRTFGALREHGSNAAIEPAVVDALESCGVDIFLRGVVGIPPRVRRVLAAIAPHLSLQFKRDTAHFLAVGCRRFGLFYLQDIGATVRGTVTGDIESNGLATKVTVRRETSAMTHTLRDAFFQYPTLRNKVEFNFEGEEGTGEGPTQELYAELSHRYELHAALWHERDDGSRVAFPSLREVHEEEFFVLGAACARAFVDGYAMDINILPCAWPFVRFQEPTEEARWDAMAELEPALTASFRQLFAASTTDLEAMGLEDENGSALTKETFPAYVTHRMEERLALGVTNLRWFAIGIASVMDISAFWLLSDEEVSTVLCGANREEDSEKRLFDEEELRAVVSEAHGYSPGSREVAMLVSIVGGEFTRQEQIYFVEFLTGSQRLPLNGLSGFGRKITVVRKEMEGSGEQMLPSCNTCFLYFKLPPYSSRAIMKERLIMAITEGRKNFSLS